MKAHTKIAIRLRQAALSFTLILGSIITASLALAGPATSRTGTIPTSGSGLNEIKVPAFSAPLSPEHGDQDIAHRMKVTQIDSNAHRLDLGNSAIDDTDKPNRLPAPNGGTIGTSNAYMVASPDVISTSIPIVYGAGILLSGFTPHEVVSWYVRRLASGLLHHGRKWPSGHRLS